MSFFFKHSIGKQHFLTGDAEVILSCFFLSSICFVAASIICFICTTRTEERLGMQNMYHKNSITHCHLTTTTKYVTSYLHFGEHARTLRWWSWDDLRLFDLLKARHPLPLLREPLYRLRDSPHSTGILLITKNILVLTKQKPKWPQVCKGLNNNTAFDVIPQRTGFQFRQMVSV